jgi:hypothetical protein
VFDRHFGKDARMRSTVTLDADAEATVRRLIRERRLSFQQALNAAIRAGSPGRRRGSVPVFASPTFDMGAPAFPIDKAVRLAAQVEVLPSPDWH